MLPPFRFSSSLLSFSLVFSILPPLLLFLYHVFSSPVTFFALIRLALFEAELRMSWQGLPLYHLFPKPSLQDETAASRIYPPEMLYLDLQLSDVVHTGLLGACLLAEWLSVLVDPYPIES